MFLLDTNILFSYLLGQNDHASSLSLFKTSEVQHIRLHITDFAIYSLSLVLTRRSEQRLLNDFLKLLDSSPQIKVIKLKTGDLEEISRLTQELPLDFDDSLHYYVSRAKKLDLVSFDADYDQTDLERYEPKDVLERFI